VVADKFGSMWDLQQPTGSK